MARCAFLALASLLAGCSALIEPDPSRLGGGQDGGAVDGSTCARCDDGVACTTDACEGDGCAHVPKDSACGAGERCNPVIGCVPERCTRHEECDDGLFCNGEERCDPALEGTGCAPGTPPSCADDVECTVDRCDDAAGACVHEPDHGACADAFACTVDACDPAAGCVFMPDDALCASDFCTAGGTCSVDGGCSGGPPRDCSDDDPCTVDSCDGAASACVNAPRDGDGDGASAARISSGGAEVACGGPDCDDADASVHPGAAEACDGVDNDCDGAVDEGCVLDVPEDCATAEAITLSPAREAHVAGRIEHFADDYDTHTICGAGSNGRDAVYYLDIPNGTWDITVDTIGSEVDTVLGVGAGNTCGATLFQQICNDDVHRGVETASRVWVHRIERTRFGGPSRLYILVDTYSAATTSGGFQLNVRLRPARGDQCPSSASTLAFDITGGGSLLGVQSDWIGGNRGSCQGSFENGGEAVLHFAGSSSGDADFDVYSLEFTPTIYVREQPCTSGSERACEEGSALGGGVGGASLTESVTSGEHYFLFVEGRGSYAVYYDPS